MLNVAALVSLGLLACCAAGNAQNGASGSPRTAFAVPPPATPATAPQQPEVPPLPTAVYDPYSTTAMGFSDEIRTAPGVLIFGSQRIELRDGKPLTGVQLRNAAALMPAELKPGASAAMYRVHIPADAKFKGGNTMCGRSPTTFVLVLENGRDLDLAMFSGAAVPDLAPAAVNNSLSLCGTFGFTRR